MRIYAAGASMLAWFTLALQLILSIRAAPSDAAAIVSAILTYLSFFTILTNLLVALVLTFSFWSEGTGRQVFFARPTVQSAAAAYIAIVGVTYSLLLRALWNPQGAQKLADVLLHDAMPVIYVLFWFLFVRKRELRWKDAFLWLLYPAVYAVYVLVRGAWTGRYPYPFLDVTELGYPLMLENAGLFVLVFLAVGLAVVAIGRWIGSREAAAG